MGTATEAGAPAMFPTPEAAEQAFYEALNRNDMTALMQVWADEEEIVCVHPGGLRACGFEAVRESWLQVRHGDGRHIERLQPLVMASMLCAIHVLIERVSVPTPAGMAVSNCYVTNAYHKGPAGWRMVLHHASFAPREASVFDLHDLPNTLH